MRRLEIASRPIRSESPAGEARGCARARRLSFLFHYMAFGTEILGWDLSDQMGGPSSRRPGLERQAPFWRTLVQTSDRAEIRCKRTSLATISVAERSRSAPSVAFLVTY